MNPVTQRHQLRNHSHVIFDVLYGFISITPWEAKIIDSPFFQRLRWIKQLGFSNYIFPGAEHSRFSHTVGVMHSMHQMISSLGIGVSDDELFDPKVKTKQAMLHKSLRIAALLHDIGTFPFSHAIEHAYIRHGNDQRRPRDQENQNKEMKDLPNSHEHLGSFIIKNTPYPGGITHILEEYDFDIQLISQIIKGNSPHLIANQLMHSDLDADRIDYLLRDAHYTGIKYGQFDKDYILANLVTFSPDGKQEAFGVRENAAHAVEDFLISRFSWYSQVIKNPGSAKFDIMSSHIAEAFLKNDLIHQFQDLLQMIENQDERFYWWNDVYFINRCQEISRNEELKDPKAKKLNRMLLYRKAPKTIELPLFEHRILQPGKNNLEREKLIQKIKKKVTEFESALKKYGSGDEWILTDIPHKDVSFTSSYQLLIQNRKNDNLYLERDPIKIVSKKGEPSLLIEKENTMMKILSGYINFVPSVYANDSAYLLLKSKKLI